MPGAWRAPKGEIPAHRSGEPDFPVHRLCRVLGVSQSGYFAWKDRPASRRRRDDMVMLAPVRPAFALSNGTYGSPRMTRELQDDGFAIGRRRTARLMRENGLRGRQKRRFKRTTDSAHAWPVAPNIIDQDFTATASTRSGAWTSRTSGHAKDGSIWPWSSISSLAASSAGPWVTACTATWRSRPCARPSSWASARRAHPSFGPRQPISFCGVPSRAAPPRHPHLHVGKRKLLRRCHGRDVLQDHRIRTRQADGLLQPRPGRNGHCPLYRRILQPRQAPLGA